MNIDHVSRQIIKIALYLNEKNPGLVSEIWIDKKIIEEIESSLPNNDQIAMSFQIDRVTNQELQELETKLSELENKAGKTRKEILQKHRLSAQDYESSFYLPEGKLSQASPSLSPSRRLTSLLVPPSFSKKV